MGTWLQFSKLNLTLIFITENGEMSDGENNVVVPLVLSADLELLKNVNGMQVLFIDSSQVNIIQFRLAK